MTQRAPQRDRHLASATLLDFLEGHLTAAEQSAAEEHLAGPCARCRERLRATGELQALMRADRTPAPPVALRRVALDVFAPAATPIPEPAWHETLARLVYDSFATPQPARVRRTVGDVRRLRFELEHGTLEVELEREAAGVLAVRGRLVTADPALCRIELEAGDERLSAWPGSDGSFAFDSVPPGPVTLSCVLPHGRVVAGPFELPDPQH